MLSEILKNKKAEDFTRIELEALANEYGVSFTETNRDVTIFSNLLKSLESFAPAKVKIKILNPVAGQYRLSYNVGEIVFHDANQAAEMVENKDAEFVK
jgi:hypothetical protein